MKVEHKEGRIYSVTATPMEKEGKALVIEYIRDITECMLMYNFNAKTLNDICKEIERLNTLVITDDLTKCYNRRFINERLPSNIQKAKDKNEKLSIAIMDIDNFKQINDTYNHVVGDYILEEVAQIIRINIRKEYDWVARYGGEEFIIVFKDTNKQQAIQMSNTLRNVIANHRFKYRDVEIKLSASFGVAELLPEIDTMERIVELADNKLYEAKNNEKNIVIG